jgi:hypothetical protein
VALVSTKVRYLRVRQSPAQREQEGSATQAARQTRDPLAQLVVCVRRGEGTRETDDP